jgi:hypothetical protein
MRKDRISLSELEWSPAIGEQTVQGQKPTPGHWLGEHCSFPGKMWWRLCWVLLATHLARVNGQSQGRAKRISYRVGWRVRKKDPAMSRMSSRCICPSNKSSWVSGQGWEWSPFGQPELEVSLSHQAKKSRGSWMEECDIQEKVLG